MDGKLNLIVSHVSPGILHSWAFLVFDNSGVTSDYRVSGKGSRKKIPTNWPEFLLGVISS